MYYGAPISAQCVLQGQARSFQPTSIDEINGAVRPRAPDGVSAVRHKYQKIEWDSASKVSVCLNLWTSYSAATAALIRRSGRFPNDQLWRDGKFFWVVLEALYALEKDACRGFTHIVQWLANRGEPRVVIARNVNVVESDDGDVFRHTQIRIAQSANRTDGRNVIERYERGEFAPVLQKLLNNGVAKLRRSQIALELDGEIWRNFDNEIASDGHDAAPVVIPFCWLCPV